MRWDEEIERWVDEAGDEWKRVLGPSAGRAAPTAVPMGIEFWQQAFQKSSEEVRVLTNQLLGAGGQIADRDQELRKLRKEALLRL